MNAIVLAGGLALLVAAAVGTPIALGTFVMWVLGL